MKMNYIFVLIAIIGLFIIPVSATIDVTPTLITSTSILWSWPPTTLTNMSIDGIYVCGFNPIAGSFILSDLKPNEPHTIIILSAADSGTNISTTLADSNANQSGGILILLNTWGYLILIAIFCVIGMKRKLGFFLIIAAVISLYKLYNFITTTSINGSLPISELPFLIYLSFFIIPLFLCFVIKGGITK